MSPSRLLSSVTIALAAALLFLGEPMAAKQLLPAFGGSASVWITCLVFFQTALLAGYLYAHLLTRRPHAKGITALHLTLLALAVIGSLAWASGRIHPGNATLSPISSILTTLTLSIGLPFLVLGSTGPLLQFWLAGGGAVPYRLFALSNAASLLALFAYPTLIEPHLPLSTQRVVWTYGFVVFAICTAVISVRNPRRSKLTTGDSGLQNNRPPSLRARLLWFLLPMAGSMQLSAVTAHITSNIAAIPLLWILPLAVYLLTWILAFGGSLLPLRPFIPRFLVVMLAGLGYFLSHADHTLPLSITIAFFLGELFAACLFLHAETASLKPASPAESTLFYLLIAAGGATGSFLIGIAAPLIFFANYDLPLTFVATAALALAVTWRQGLPQRLLWSTATALLIFLVVALQTAYHRRTMVTIRNFYGTLRVQQTVTPEGDPIRILLNGSIEHGTEIFTQAMTRTPTTYYAEDSGIGLALRNCCPGRTRKIGVIGLGAGTLAAYGVLGDQIRFYEISRSVQSVATGLFVYIRLSAAEVSFAMGDARASLAVEPPQNFDVLAVDAFSGDAIPVHLLTAEALAIYRKHLAPGGIIAFHVSNQFVDLTPEIAQLASAAGMHARVVSSDENPAFGEFNATWILVANDPAVFNAPGLQTARPIPLHTGLRAWTDDYSSLLPLIRW